MKSSAETQDGAIDNLLRAYVSRPSNPHQVCPDFDPDQANAYVEHSLTGPSRSKYEQHLSECPPCRKSVVALMRLADGDSLAVVPAVREPVAATWFDGVRRMLGALAQPRWALAAAAIIVAAISLPLILSRNAGRDSTRGVAEQVASQQAQTPAAGLSEPEQPAGVVANQPASVSTNPSASTRSAQSHAVVSTAGRENSAEKQQLTVRNDPPAVAADSATGTAAGVDLSKKAEARSAGERVGESQRKSESQVGAAPPSAGAVPGTQSPRSDFDQSRQQQAGKDAAQQTTETKTVARAEEGAKEKSERAEDVAPPAPRAPSEEARARSSMRRAGKLALRDSNAEAVRPEERRLSGKKFLFREGIWTDKDFDPNKDLPSVTIIRDSNVYSEVINKRPGLKPFLTGFHAAERAIIVFKGTVYKLIPQ